VASNYIDESLVQKLWSLLDVRLDPRDSSNNKPDDGGRYEPPPSDQREETDATARQHLQSPDPSYVIIEARDAHFPRNSWGPSDPFLFLSIMSNTLPWYAMNSSCETVPSPSVSILCIMALVCRPRA